MTKCEKCGQEIDLPFYCKFCHKEFCADHRLPESHDCKGLPARQLIPTFKPRTTRVNYCSNCGALNQEGAKYCTKCGKKFSSGEVPKEEPITQGTKPRRSISIKKIIGAILIIIIIVPLLWYASPIISFITSHISSQNNAHPSWNTETFQLIQGSLLAPVTISRHFELQSGNHLVGNFQFINLPPYYYVIDVGILDPLQGILQYFYNKTSGSFNITASINGAYEIDFGFTCTQQVTPPSVTLNTRIVK